VPSSTLAPLVSGQAISVGPVRAAAKGHRSHAWTKSNPPGADPGGQTGVEGLECLRQSVGSIQPETW
jgi:hypothetical protein